MCICLSSTLLDIIAGRKTQGTITGEILFDGYVRTPALQQSIAYVLQDSVHIAALTVWETLYFAAELRLDESLPKVAKTIRVDEVLSILGLTEHANTLVGNESARGISGGQLKRLSIGTEIIHHPGVVLLDEPTSGLDSAIAHDVMSSVRRLADTNKTVGCHSLKSSDF